MVIDEMVGRMNHPAESALHEREKDFHDAWAASTDLSKIRVRECFEAAVAQENRFILRRMGNLAGKTVLDIGAGLGESSVYFALCGAKVTTTDISPLMVQKAVALAREFGVDVSGIVSTAESLNVPDESFDFVYIANTIHHVHDREKLWQQIHRALKANGWFFSCDPLAYNPVINVYRRMATAVRTEDESPLKKADIELAKKCFCDVGHREFWILSLALFLKYFLVDRLHPNADRYWKRIFDEKPGDLWWWKPLYAMDRLITRLPGVRWLAWNVVIWGRKQAP
jgi:SAM-dependent methyltransferase